MICLARTNAGAANASSSGIIGALTICSGAMFAALLGDMISLWLALTLASFGAVALAADRPQASTAAFRLLMVSGAGGVLHAVGVVLVIATAETAALLGPAGQIGRSGNDALLAVGTTCVFVGVIAQAGLFPFHAVIAQAVRGAPRGSDQTLVMVLGVAAIAVLARWTQALAGDEPSRLSVAGLSVLSAWGGVGALASAAAAVRGSDARTIMRHAFASAAMTAVMMLATGGRVADAALLWLAGAVTGAAAAAVALDASGYDDTVPLVRLDGFAARAPIMAAAFGIGFAGLAALPLTPSFVAAFEGMSALFAALQPVKGCVIAAVIVLLATAGLRMGERMVSRTETGHTMAAQRGAMHVTAAIFALVLIVGAWTLRPLNDLALLANESILEPSR
jgi:formate hydrogenlyase subunit 3/multisubunit Na+/H+ antiporter MnhD subunit